MNSTLPQFDFSYSDDQRDSLMDKMQEKIGELLSVNRELCESNKQLSILQETLQKERDEFMIKETDFHNQLNDLQNKLLLNENSMVKIKQENLRLKDQNQQLQNQLSSLNEENEKMTNQSKSTIENQISLRTKEFKETIRIQEEQIRKLTKQLREAKESSSVNSELANQKVHEMNKLSTDHSHLEDLFTEQNQYIQQANEKIISLKSLLNESKNSIISLQNNVNELQTENSQLTQKVEHLQKKYQLKKELLNDFSVKILDYMDLDENCTKPSYNTFFSVCQANKDQLRSLTEDYSSLNVQFKKAQAILNNQASEIQALSSSKNELLEQLKSYQIENEKLVQNDQVNANKISYLLTRNKIGILFEKINRELMQKFYNIQQNIHPDHSNLTFKSLITFSLLARRFEKIDTTKKAFVSDQQNWWWLKNESFHVLNEIESLFKSQKQALKVASSEKESTNNLLQETAKSIQAAEQEIKRLLIEGEKKNKQLAQSQEVIQKMEEALKEAISPSKYNKITQKLKNAIEKIKEYEVKLQDNENKMMQMNAELVETKEQLNQKSMIIKQKDKALENAQHEIIHSREGIIKLEKGMKAKTRDLLSLERAIDFQKKTTDATRSQCQVLSMENKRYATQMKRELMHS